MRFLIDAQLPRRLAHRLREAGHNAVHTLDLPAQNFTADTEIMRVAAGEKRVVVTKDADFVTSFTLHRQPEKLLLISTGNITNAAFGGAIAAKHRDHRRRTGRVRFGGADSTALIVHS